MTKKLELLIIILLLSCNLFAQEKFKEFKIQKPEILISNSLYKTIHFIDSRIDTTNMGIVQVGVMNNHAKVISINPLQSQLNDILSSVIDSTSLNGTLLLQIRQLLFAETTSLTCEKGYCYLRANLFSKKDDDYVKLVSLDTLVIVKSMDVTNLLLKTGSNLITDIIINNLTSPQTNNDLYSYNDILKTDSIEKRNIKLYNTDKYVDGLYYNYNSFKAQIPDKKIKVKSKRDFTISNIRIIDDYNNLVKIKSNEFYAFVHEGKPYISTGYGYYPLYKGNDNFYFVGVIKPMTKNNNEVVAASMMFGLIGGLIAVNSDGQGENYFIIIDHINGGFIQIRKIPSEQI